MTWIDRPGSEVERVTTLSCPSRAPYQSAEARESGGGGLRCLRHSGTFFRWRAERDFRHDGVRTRAASASQNALDDFGAGAGVQR